MYLSASTPQLGYSVSRRRPSTLEDGGHTPPATNSCPRFFRSDNATRTAGIINKQVIVAWYTTYSNVTCNLLIRRMSMSLYLRHGGDLPDISYEYQDWASHLMLRAPVEARRALPIRQPPLSPYLWHTKDCFDLLPSKLQHSIYMSTVYAFTAAMRAGFQNTARMKTNPRTGTAYARIRTYAD